MLYSNTEYRLCHQKNWFRSDGKGRIICNYTYSEIWSYKTLMQEKCFFCYSKGEKITGNFQYTAMCKIQVKSYWIFTCHEVVWWRGGVASLQKALLFKPTYLEMLKGLNAHIWFILVDLGNIILRQHLTLMFWHHRRQLQEQEAIQQRERKSWVVWFNRI